MTLSLPRALFLPNNESFHKPPPELIAFLNRDKNGTLSQSMDDIEDQSVPSPSSNSPLPSAKSLSLQQQQQQQRQQRQQQQQQRNNGEFIQQTNKLWNGVYYGHYHDKLTTLSQIIYTNPLWITCSGYTQSQTRISVKRFVLPGLDETALRELGIEAYTRGQLSLQCPNILPVLGFNVSGSSLCIISEYKQRRSLFDFLLSTEKNIAPMGILKLALAIATGMECLHSNEYVHGHFNSRNVILDESLQIYIADVGDRSVRIFAEAMYGSHLHTQWCAPEVLVGATPTKASDVYSFGVICWELCYRLIPFQYYNLKELRTNVGKNGDRLLLPSSDEIAKAQMLAKNAGKSLKHVIPYEFIKLVTRCFYSIDLRPSFSDIVESLQSILDHMVKIKD